MCQQKERTYKKKKRDKEISASPQERNLLSKSHPPPERGKCKRQVSASISQEKQTARFNKKRLREKKKEAAKGANKLRRRSNNGSIRKIRTKPGKERRREELR